MPETKTKKRLLGAFVSPKQYDSFASEARKNGRTIAGEIRHRLFGKASKTTKS